MIIGINLYNLHPGAGGINHYTLTLIRHWHDYYSKDKLLLFCFDHNQSILDHVEKKDGIEFKILKTQEEIGDEAGRKTFDIFFCPLQTYYPRPLAIPTVVTCHDIQERFFPEYFTPEDVASRLYHYDWSIRMADAVVTISDFTKKSCNHIIGTKQSKMMTIHHTPDALPRPQMPRSWPFDKYVDFAYFPANDWAHKNHDRVLQIAERIVEQGIDLKIVLTGFQHRGEDWWIAEIEKRSLSDTLIHLGHIARPEVSWLYQNSIGLFFPSLFEGGGIPVIEAMSIGCPVACSALDALREVAGDSVLYFDPYDIDAMLSALMSLKTQESLRGALGAAGKAKSATFVYEKQIRDHRRVMEKARERYSPLKFWIRNKWLQPRSEKRFHKTVPKKQLVAAQALLTVNHSLCTNKPIEIIPGEVQPTSSGNVNPRDFASVVRGLEYLPFDSLPQVEGREDLLKKQSGTGVAAAFYIVRYLQDSMHLEGDVCELGVASGASAALIANEIKTSSKKMWLFDTFEGLPAPTTEDVLIDDIFGYGSIEKYKGQMAHGESEVLRKLAEIEFSKDRCHIIKGKVEESLKTANLPDRISFAYIDLDFYSGVKHALEFLNERLVRGGATVIDDYDFFSLGAKKAVDEFIARNASAYEFHLPQAQFGAFCILRKRN